MTEPTFHQEVAAIMADSGDDPTDMWAHYRAVNTAMGRRGLLKTSNRPAEQKMEEEEVNE